MLRVSFQRFSALTALILTSFSVRAEPVSIPWENLHNRVADRLIPLQQLRVEDCPKEATLRPPDRLVLQVIENSFYSWEERDLGKDSEASFCVVMRQPFHRPLTVGEAQVLLTASSLWTEPLPLAGSQESLSPDDPRLMRSPAPAPVLGRSSQKDFSTGPDRGLVGWKGDGSGPPETSERGLDKALGPFSAAPDETVIGQDGRVRVTGTSAFPFNNIAFLSYNQGGSGFRATGFLVSPHMVLTNGHVVWDDQRSRFVTQMEISPGQVQAAAGGQVTRPFGTRSASRFATNPGWVATRNIQYDYSAAFFDTPFQGISTFIPLAFDVSPAVGSTVHIAGYPGQALGQDTFALWQGSDKIDSVQGRVLRYKTDTTPGNSGSPVWQVVPGTGQLRAIAVHSTGDPELRSTNSGARLVTQNFELISEWMQWQPQLRTGLNLRINQVDAADCPLIRAITSVTNSAGQPVTDLTRLDFAVTENGVPQTIQVEQGSVSNNPIAVSMVLDASSSLSDNDVANVRLAARAFVDLLHERDKASVFHFAAGVALAQGFTTDAALLKNAINRLDNRGGLVGDGGGTALYDAIIEAANQPSNGGRRAIVVMTDGQNNRGTSDLQAPINAARAAGIPVFTIGFGSVDQFVLSSIADQTGGRFFLGASSADLQTILGLIGRTLDNQYLITWVSRFISGGTEGIEIRAERNGESAQETATYSQSGTAGCPVPNTSCTARIVSPNGGEVWAKGQRQTIRWSTDGPSCGSVVGLGISNGSEIWPLGDTADDGSQAFNIDFLPPGDGYRAVVVDRATTVGAVGVSNNPFSISASAAGFKCTAGPQTLCLQGGRFQVRLLWKTSSGNGFGNAVALNGQAGYFWFGGKDSPEVLVKMADGRAVNLSYWFFSGALTNVEYTIFVSDSRTGATRVYTSQEGDFNSFGDVNAFAPPPEGENATGGNLADSSPEASEEAGAKAILWNQMSNPYNLGTASENRLEAGADALDCEAADDFVVPAQTTWEVNGVDVKGFYFTGGPQGPASSVNVVIYADQQGAPGPARCSYARLRPRAGLANGSFEMDLPTTCRLSAGRYWLAVQSNQNAPVNGRWAWQETSNRRERASVWRNPGGGFGTSCSGFQPRVGVCGAGEKPDLLFQIRGQVGSGTGNGSCRASSSALCLAGKRFQVELTFKDASGRPGTGKTVALTSTTGSFWFTSASSPEVAVKIVDGSSVNGKYWIFIAGLTNLEYTLKVTDTVAGRQKLYTNPRGRFQSQADTQTFPSF